VTIRKASGELLIRELPSGKLVRTLPKPKTTSSVAYFSPDGKTFVHRIDTDVLRVSSLQDDNELARLTGHGGGGLGAVFQPEGKWGARGWNTLKKVWGGAEGKEGRALKPPMKTITLMLFSPQGGWLAGVGGKKLIVWDTKSWRVAREKEYPNDIYPTMSFSVN